jgi:hypothetical protein
MRAAKYCWKLIHVLSWMHARALRGSKYGCCICAGRIVRSARHALPMYLRGYARDSFGERGGDSLGTMPRVDRLCLVQKDISLREGWSLGSGTHWLQLFKCSQHMKMRHYDNRTWPALVQPRPGIYFFLIISLLICLIHRFHPAEHRFSSQLHVSYSSCYRYNDVNYMIFLVTNHNNSLRNSQQMHWLMLTSFIFTT